MKKRSKIHYIKLQKPKVLLLEQKKNLPLHEVDLGEQERLMSTRAAVQSSIIGSTEFGHLLLLLGEKKTQKISLNFIFLFSSVCN